MNTRTAVLTLTTVVLAATSGVALLRPGTVWYTSQDVNNPFLVQKMCTVETLGRARKYREAADALGDLLATTNTDARAELDRPNAHDGPLDLQLTVERCRYLALCGEHVQAARLCSDLETKYAEAAAGKEWESYARSFLYRAHVVPAWWKSPVALTLVERALDHYPTYSWAMGDYMQVSYNLRETRGLADARSRYAAYEAAGGERSAKADLNYLKMLAADGADPFPRALDFLDRYPDTSEAPLLEVIDIARVNINPEQPEQIRAFYDALTTLALRQAGGEQNISVVAHILNEKEKLQTIVPELSK